MRLQRLREQEETERQLAEQKRREQEVEKRRIAELKAQQAAAEMAKMKVNMMSAQAKVLQSIYLCFSAFKSEFFSQTKKKTISRITIAILKRI